MIDFGVLLAFKNRLATDTALQQHGLGEVVHTVLPQPTAFPCVLLEIEEIWTSMRLGAEIGFIKLKIKVSTLSEKMSSRESISMADCVRSIVDGKILATDTGKKGMVKLTSSIIDMPSNNRPLSVQQFYEVLIRG